MAPPIIELPFDIAISDYPITIAHSSDDCPIAAEDVRSCYLPSSDIDYGPCFADRDNPHRNQVNFMDTAGFTLFGVVQFWWLNDSLSIDRRHSCLIYNWDSVGKLKEIQLDNYKPLIPRTTLWYRDAKDQVEELSRRKDIRECLAVRRVVSGPADLMICIDSSSSMEDAIEQVKRAVVGFVETIERTGLDVRLGLIDYKCGAADSPYIFIHSFTEGTFTSDYDAFIAEVNTLGASGGGSIDQHESSLDAIYTATQQFWRPAPVTRNILLIGDDIPAIPDVIMPSMAATIDEIRDAGIDHIHLYLPPDIFSTYEPLQDVAPGEFQPMDTEIDLYLNTLLESILLLDGREIEISSSYFEDTAGVIAQVQTLRGTYGRSSFDHSPTEIESVPVVYEGEGILCPEIQISDFDSTLSETFSEVALHFDSTGLLKRVYHRGIFECEKIRFCGIVTIRLKELAASTCRLSSTATITRSKRSICGSSHLDRWGTTSARASMLAYADAFLRASQPSLRTLTAHASLKRAYIWMVSAWKQSITCRRRSLFSVAKKRWSRRPTRNACTHVPTSFASTCIPRAIAYLA